MSSINGLPRSRDPHRPPSHLQERRDDHRLDPGAELPGPGAAHGRFRSRRAAATSARSAPLPLAIPITGRFRPIPSRCRRRGTPGRRSTSASSGTPLSATHPSIDFERSREIDHPANQAAREPEFGDYCQWWIEESSGIWSNWQTRCCTPQFRALRVIRRLVEFARRPVWRLLAHRD